MTAKRFFSAAIVSALLFTTVGCGSWWLPRPHKIDIQQGNLLPPESVEKIAEGMSKQEVVNTLGEPVATNFFDQQRWDYLYSLNRSGDTPNAKRLTLWFENDRVVSLETDGFNE